jgi:hypothetical protein
MDRIVTNLPTSKCVYTLLGIFKRERKLRHCASWNRAILRVGPDLVLGSLEPCHSLVECFPRCAGKGLSDIGQRLVRVGEVMQALIRMLAKTSVRGPTGQRSNILDSREKMIGQID